MSTHLHRVQYSLTINHIFRANLIINQSTPSQTDLWNKEYKWSYRTQSSYIQILQISDERLSWERSPYPRSERIKGLNSGTDCLKNWEHLKNLSKLFRKFLVPGSKISSSQSLLKWLISQINWISHLGTLESKSMQWSFPRFKINQICKQFFWRMSSPHYLGLQ